MRLLIFGASGYLGGEIHREAIAAGIDVVGTGFQSETEGLVRVDLRDGGAVERVIEQVRPSVVVNTAYLQSDWATTAVGPVHIARACAKTGARLVHISSDAVFSGGRNRYDESCEPSPVTPYGAAKAAAEVAVGALMDEAAIVRTSWILGDGRSAFERFVHGLASGAVDGALFDDDVRCPVHVGDLAAALLELVGGVRSGLFHIGGSDALSRHELGRLIASRDGLDPASLPASAKEEAGERGIDVRLDSSRTLATLRTPVRGARAFLGASRDGS